jgi:hypothetical protein
MKKWKLDLEIIENEDEFFQTLDYATQHKVLQNFILDMLNVNGFHSRIRLNHYEETHEGEPFLEAKGVTNANPKAS